MKEQASLCLTSQDKEEDEDYNDQNNDVNKNNSATTVIEESTNNNDSIHANGKIPLSRYPNEGYANAKELLNATTTNKKNI